MANVAPLLAEHCLECHDAPNRAGGLDLAHRRTALAGGDTGPAIVPGDAEQSALLASVLGGEMPLDRPALSPEEIEILKTWISRGATWSLDFVDPALFVHGGESTYFIQRLTTDEYIATVKTTFDVDITEEARKLLPQDLRADGFVNTAYNLQVDLKHVESYARLAEIIVSKMDVQAFAKRFTKRLRFTDKDIGALIENMGMWILRGPLDEREVIAYRGISTTVASAGGSYEEAVGLLIEAMIQSPRFVYRMENQAGDGSQWPVNQWELASRMSYILWGSSPDTALHKVAKSGEIFDPAVQAQHVDRMLDDPRARERALEFARQWLNLSALDNLQPDSQRFPGWNSRLASDMQQESLAFFEEVAWNQDRRLSDLLSAQVTFVSPELAKHYRLRGTARPWEGRPGWLRYDLHDDSSRGGLLTQGSVLTVGGDNASMVTRGLFVMHDLMRGVVKDPPPCVDATPVPSKAGLTQRMIAMERIENESCGGCHAKFEPLAFGLERFDGLGAYAEQDQFGNELRDDGEVLFPGQADSLPYENAQQLMQLLADSERVQQSLTWKLVQFAVGRPLAAKDATVVDGIHRRASSAGGTYRDLMKEIVRSDLVQLTQTESNSEG